MLENILNFQFIDIGAIFLATSIILILIDAMFLLLPNRMKKWHKINNISLLLSSLFFFIAFIYFVIAIMTPDFRFVYVSSYVSRDMDIFLKFSAIWSGSSGSFFFWSFTSMIYYICYRVIFRNFREELIISRSMGIFSIQVASLAFLTLISDPFALNSSTITNGRGLNPILTNIWNITHPPIILIGYTLCLAPMVIALARISLMKDNKIPTFLSQKRLNAFFELSISSAWLFLSTGIAIGAYWAYVTLGWGGFWNWDPVQASSLIPWLFITIYYHGKPYHKYNRFLENYVVSMVYIGVLFATFVTRSGVLSSIHSFAPDNKVLFLFLILGLSFILLHYLGYKNKEIFNIDLNFSKNDFILSKYKETALKISFLSALFGTYVIIGGLLFPLFYGFLSNLFPEVILSLNLSPTISIGATYFNNVLAIFAGGMLIMAFFCEFFGDFDFRSRLVMLILGIVVGIIFLVGGLGFIDPLFGSNNPILDVFKSFLTTSDKANLFIPILCIGIVGVAINILKIIIQKDFGHLFQKGSQSILHLSFIIIMLGAIISSNMANSQVIEVMEGSIADVPNTNLTLAITKLIKKVPEEGKYSEEFDIEVIITSESMKIGNRTLIYGIDPYWGRDRQVTIIPILFNDLYLVIEQVFENEETGDFSSALIQIKYLPMISILWFGIILLHLAMLPLVTRRIRIFVKLV